MKRVAVIGGGPAGIMAAGQAALDGAEVWLFEKKERIGRKLRITGNGRCNLTTSVDTDLLLKGFPGNGRFLYSAFSELSNWDLREFFHRRGLMTKVESGNRVFPVSDRAEDVVGVLFEYARGAGVKYMLSTPVLEILIQDARVAGLKTEKEVLEFEALVIATGGLSYPGTGSTGDGYGWARAAGHRIIEPRPGLIPLLVQEEWIGALQGLSLDKVKAVAYSDTGKRISEDCGELLFTHYGLSGPMILAMSHAIGERLFKYGPPVKIILDLEPDYDEKVLDELLQRIFKDNSRKILKNALGDLLPPKLIPVVIELSGIKADKECHQVNRSERQELEKQLKEFTLTVVGLRPIAEAIVTAGGVDVKQVNPRTMESKLVKGLFFAGEVLDVDGLTGGYNLQAAFSTGYVAGKNAALG
ncbi:MAG: NAD(P)/FAD-dependent oxidoreductase [Syntrophomonadaceae bacterium]